LKDGATGKDERETRRTVYAKAFLEAGADRRHARCSGPALAQAAQQPSRVKGLRVVARPRPEELDDAYDQSVYAPNQPAGHGRYATNSEITRARLGPRLRFAYGSAPRRGTRCVRAKRFQRSGQRICPRWAWRGGLAKELRLSRGVVVNAGAHFVVLDFSPVQDFAGN